MTRDLRWGLVMIDQLGIAVCGVGAVFLTQSRSERLRRLACLFGLFGQPFWFWATISSHQWGSVFVSFMYTIAWAHGVWVHWIARR